MCEIIYYNYFKLNFDYSILTKLFGISIKLILCLELISISIIDICTVKYDESVHYNSQC